MTTATADLIKDIYRVTIEGEQFWKVAYILDAERYELPGEWLLDQKAKAQLALDQAVYDHLFQRAPATSDPMTPDEELLPVDPTTPFGTSGGPALSWCPTAQQLQVAGEHLCSFYPDGLTVGTRTLDVAGRAAKALTALHERPVHILADGSLVMAGGTAGETYLVQATTCMRVQEPLSDANLTDPSSWAPVTTTNAKTKKKTIVYCKGFLHGNMCYHALARELLRLSQILAEREAVATIDARLLSGFLYAAQRTQQPVGLQVLPAGFVINAGGAHTVIPAETDGALTAEFTVPTETFAQFWDAFKPLERQLASQQEPMSAEVWLNPREGEVNIVVVDAEFHYRLAA
jgi:hypothetical protein